ncbi:MAG: Phytoene dehydrogenase and related proteins-like [uncultured Sulfurovum sp.]|uniref:Phytoene dehydrogenase and related proteins-like n=1 Tax=uncultured Sulfurovum sp. TaxID=269237 RepID=A0A6S6T375_9BACT|nr:MAG: Phytoene dehydrogenase and related proteins-like [uncultured Sulfurovum sp.]
MEIYDVAVIGSGIGGTLFSALNQKKHKLIVFEKEPNLGGCASTFKRFGGYYNAGATTFMGYEEGHIIKKMFDEVGYVPKLTKTSHGVRIVQGEKQVDRLQDFDAFLTQMNVAYPNQHNEKFWRTLKEIDEKFWKLKKLYYAKHSFKGALKSVQSVAELLRHFKFDLFTTAPDFISNTLGDISPEYQNFIDAQLLITLQTNSKELSLLTMALGLSYTFHATYYVQGGMGELIENLLKEVNVKRAQPIVLISWKNGLYEIKSTKNTYYAKNIVLNSSIYDSAKLFEDKAIKSYYNKFSFSNQSAFVLYLRINSPVNFLHHYQVVLKDLIPHSISNAFFVSFSDINDTKLTQNGYSVTLSTHTKVSEWKDLSTAEYKAKKEELQNYLTQAFLDYFKEIKKEEISQAFSATSNTFKRYIGRENCGGEALKLKNIFNIPSCTTPFKGLYNVGDTVFAGQGWAGVALGVEVLNEEFNYSRIE